MRKGTIIENSLADKRLLDMVRVVRTWQEGDWTLHDVLVEEGLAPELGKYLADGPWYIHLWQPGEDEFLIIYKDQTFTVKKSDPASFAGAIAHGTALGIPAEQLDFPTD